MVKSGYRWKDIEEAPMCKIGVFFRAAWKAAKEDIVNQTVIGWNAAHLSPEGLQEMLNKQGVSTNVKRKGKDGRLPKSVSDDKAASEMTRLANSLARGFQPKKG